MSAPSFDGTNQSTKYAFTSFLGKYTSPRFVALLADCIRHGGTPTALELYQVDGTAGPGLGVYLKIAFSLHSDESDVVYGGKSTGRSATDSLLNYGFMSRWDEHLHDYWKLVKGDPVPGPFARAIKEARERHGQVVHSVPVFFAPIFVLRPNYPP